jgi:hypothetical protein
MAVGSYGIIRPADASPEDIEIYFHYVSDRSSTSEVTLKRLSSSDVLTPVFHNSETTDDTAAPNNEILGGLYNLKLLLMYVLFRTVNCSTYRSTSYKRKRSKKKRNNV